MMALPVDSQRCFSSLNWPELLSFSFSDREEKSPSVGLPLRPLHTGSSRQRATCGASALWCGKSWHLENGPTGTWATTRYGSADRDIFLAKMARFGLGRSTLMTTSAHSGLGRWWWSLLLLTFNVIAAISSFLLFLRSWRPSTRRSGSPLQWTVHPPSISWCSSVGSTTGPNDLASQTLSTFWTSCYEVRSH